MAAWSNNHFSKSDQCYDELSINSFYSGSDGQLRQVTDHIIIKNNALLSSTVVTSQKRQMEIKTSHPWVENPGQPSSTRGRNGLSISPYNRPKIADGTGISTGRTRIEERETDKREKKKTPRSDSQSHPSEKQSCHGHLCYDSGDSLFNDDEEKLSKSSRNSTVSKGSAVLTSNKHFKSKFSAPTTVQSVTALSVAAIAGGLILGPVGVLLGTGALACAGIYHSLPEEQRQQILEDTDRTCKRTYEWGERMSDRLSASCATAFEKTGELVGPVCDTSSSKSKSGGSTSFGVLLNPKVLSSQFKNAANGEVASEENQVDESEGQQETHTDKMTGTRLSIDDSRMAAFNKRIETNGPNKGRQSKKASSRHEQKFQHNRYKEQQAGTSSSRGKMLTNFLG